MKSTEKRLAALEAERRRHEIEWWGAAATIGIAALHPAERDHFQAFCVANEAQSKAEHLALVQPDDPHRLLERPAWMLQEWYDAVLTFGTAFWPAYHARGGSFDMVPFPVYEESAHA